MEEGQSFPYQSAFPGVERTQGQARQEGRSALKSVTQQPSLSLDRGGHRGRRGRQRKSRGLSLIHDFLYLYRCSS